MPEKSEVFLKQEHCEKIGRVTEHLNYKNATFNQSITSLTHIAAFHF